MTDKTDLLAQLAAIPAERAQAAADFDKRERELVAALVQANATWEEIGGAVNMTRQSAWRKFKPLIDVEETRTVRVHPTSPKETT